MTTVSGVYLGRDRSAPASPLRGHESKISGKAFVKVDCTACHHVPLLRLEALLRVGLAARPTFFTQKAAVAVRQEGAGDGFGKGARAGRVNGGGTVRAGPPAFDQGHAVGSANGRKLVK